MSNWPCEQGGSKEGTGSGKDKPPHLEKDVTATKPGNLCREEQELVHPYAKAADVSHRLEPAKAMKPAQREAAIGRSEPTYMTHTKVFNPQIAKEVYEHAMETPITITQRELLSLAPEVHAQIANVTIKKCIPHEPVAQAMIEEVMDKDEPAPRSNTAEKHNKHMPVAYVLATHTPPANATIIPNPYKMYLKDSHLCQANPKNP